MSPKEPWRRRLYEIIFEAETPAGKAFDVFLIAAILGSVLSVMLESVESLRQEYGSIFLAVEWFFTIAFTIEYFLRLMSVSSARRYATSFFGLVDLIAILPTYLSVFIVGAQSLLVVRSFRLLRIFRVFKLTHYLAQANVLRLALRASRPKITVFLVGVLATVFTMGAVMYLIEGAENGFTSIPRSVYWAIVTMTTVGFGDITPQTVPGQIMASILMVLGYGILAVPTGIVSVEMARAGKQEKPRENYERVCPACDRAGHGPRARFCQFCGASLKKPQLVSSGQWEKD